MGFPWTLADTEIPQGWAKCNHEGSEPNWRPHGVGKPKWGWETLEFQPSRGDITEHLGHS